MKAFPGSLMRAALILAALIAAPVAIFAQTIPGRFIVQLRPGAGVDPAVVANRHGVAPIHVYRAASRGYAANIPPGLLARVATDPDVAAVIPDRVITADASADAKGAPGGGGGGTPPPQVVPRGIQRIGASPGALAYTGAGVGVAILDTGIDFAHVDLAVSASQFSAFGSSAQDDNGHGTHVAGTVAARNNTRDVVGVAPGATLYAVKVLNRSGSGSDSDIMAGLDWVAANAANVSPAIKVVNMSLGRVGTAGDNPALHDSVSALEAQGITIVVAAGNDPALEISQRVPASYAEVFAIASTTAVAGTSATSLLPVAADTASYFTTDGAGVTVSAPGEEAENILKGNRLESVGVLSTKLGGGTTRMSGTSMAAPHVAGVVALLYEQNPALVPVNARVEIMVGATLVGTAPREGRTSGYTFDGVREGVLSAADSIAVGAGE